VRSENLVSASRGRKRGRGKKKIDHGGPWEKDFQRLFGSAPITATALMLPEMALTRGKGGSKERGKRAIKKENGSQSHWVRNLWAETVNWCAYSGGEVKQSPMRGVSRRGLVSFLHFIRSSWGGTAPVRGREKRGRLGEGKIRAWEQLTAFKPSTKSRDWGVGSGILNLGKEKKKRKKLPRGQYFSYRSRELGALHHPGKKEGGSGKGVPGGVQHVSFLRRQREQSYV